MDNLVNRKLEGGLRNTGKLLPFVSIVTVVYNSENLLQKTIDSIANQTETDYEYLIIDGNSTDQTIDIIKKNESKIDYWQSEPDKGLYDAMNKALAIAKGKYILFINSGDELNDANILTSIKKHEFRCGCILWGDKSDRLYRPHIRNS